LAEYLRHPFVLQGFSQRSLLECRLWGLFREFRDVVGPVGLRTRAEAADALYAIADLRAAAEAVDRRTEVRPPPMPVAVKKTGMGSLRWAIVLAVVLLIAGLAWMAMRR
jgi:hypothetical protein